MKKCAIALGIAMLSVVTPKMWADGTGLTVTGVITVWDPSQPVLSPTVGGTNFLDSANGLVPPGYGNSTPGGTAVIGPGIEFGANDGNDLLTINYTGTTVTITDTCLTASCGSQPFTLGLYSPFITGYSILTDTIAPQDTDIGFGPSNYFPGNAALFTFQGGGAGYTGGTLTASYTSIVPTSTAVPEPATFGLLAAGLIGSAGFLRKRFGLK